MNLIETIKNFFNRTRVIVRDPMPVFVYGTLRPGEGNYSWALNGRTINEQDGFLAGTSMYSNGGFPYVIEHTEGKGVTGTLVDIDPDVLNSVMSDLDSLEGTNYGDEVPGVGKINDRNHYNRVARLIEMKDGSMVKAWVYLPPAEDNDGIMARHRYVTSGDWYEESRRPKTKTNRRVYGGGTVVTNADVADMVEFWNKHANV